MTRSSHLKSKTVAVVLFIMCIAVLSGCPSSSSGGVAEDAADASARAAGDLAGADLDSLPAGDLPIGPTEVIEDLVQPDLPDPFAHCGPAPSLAVCEAATPAPSGSSAVKQFVADNIISLRCEEGAENEWDFRILMDELAGKRVFMMGEVHGSNEIGIASAALFETMVLHGGVDVLALEIGMDTTDALNEFIETASSSAAQEIGFAMYGDNMFRRLLPEKAHELYQQGITVVAVGVDAPQRLAWVNEQLEAFAVGLPEDAQGIILDTLPEALEIADYGMMGISTSYVSQAKAYQLTVASNLDIVCAELDDDECERVEFLAYALYIGAVVNSQDFMMGAMGVLPEAELMKLMEKREVLIHYNFERALEMGDLVYAHMGAAHTAKGGWNVAEMLNQQGGMAEDAVYTTTAAYGPGSKIFYGIMSQTVPPEPKVVSDVLKDMPMKNYYLSAALPGVDCDENPFLDLPATILDAYYGVAWDALIWYRKLTPDMPGNWMSMDPLESFFASQTERLNYADYLLMEGQ